MLQVGKKYRIKGDSDVFGLDEKGIFTTYDITRP